MKQGEIWWANLTAPIGRRPVLLLSRNEAYQIRDYVSVAIITTTIRHIPVEVLLNEQDGLPRESVANLDNVMTIRKSSLFEYITQLSPEKWCEVSDAIHFAFGLED